MTYPANFFGLVGHLLAFRSFFALLLASDLLEFPSVLATKPLFPRPGLLVSDLVVVTLGVGV